MVLTVVISIMGVIGSQDRLRALLVVFKTKSGSSPSLIPIKVNFTLPYGAFFGAECSKEIIHG